MPLPFRLSTSRTASSMNGVNFAARRNSFRLTSLNRHQLSKVKRKGPVRAGAPKLNRNFSWEPIDDEYQTQRRYLSQSY